MTVNSLSESSEKDKIHLIFPNKIKLRHELCDLFAYIVTQIPKDIDVQIYSCDLNDFNTNHRESIGRNVECAEIDFNDIWLGDIFPLRHYLEENKDKKDEHKYFYFKSCDYPEDQEKLIRFLSKGELPIQEVPIKLDVGIFEWFYDKILTSGCIYDDNPNISKEELNNTLEYYFHTKNIVCLDVDSETMHIDIAIRQLFNSVLIYNPNYVNEDFVLSNFKDFYDDIEPISFDICGEINDEGVESYVGNIFDFLDCGDNLLFPITQESDKEHLDTLKKILAKYDMTPNIIVLEHPDMQKFYQMGGGLYCVMALS